MRYVVTYHGANKISELLDKSAQDLLRFQGMLLSGSGEMQNAKNSGYHIGIIIANLHLNTLTQSNKTRKFARIIKTRLKIARLDGDVYSKL